MKLIKIATVFATVGLLAACGDSSNNTSGMTSEERTTTGTLPAMETDSDPTPQTGTGGAGQSRPSGQTTP
ncbi:hypothetical protein [Rhizobium rosettiformans]|uniref:hypothetical protein n=1 Tax=Rhizobium rosettiformans TaxID=1368430 RepID=UPI002867388B|nr:hypothetical protein [Rhizobium rosettiformans]MDR7028543.1 hypothetical protein [Rhizobium rosettiformans]MDR7064175.1 hypothetical protein [Rhizobium rosettiformans]